MNTHALVLAAVVGFMPMQKGGPTLSGYSTLDRFASRHDAHSKLYLFSGGD